MSEQKRFDKVEDFIAAVTAGRTDFIGCEFVGVVFSRDLIQGVKFNSATFTRCRFNYTRFRRVSFLGAQFTQTDFYHCYFHDCNLWRAKFSGDATNPTCSRFDQVRFKRVSFVAAEFDKMAFFRCYLRNCGLNSVKFVHAHIDRSFIVGCNLTWACFSYSTINKSFFCRCDFTQVSGINNNWWYNRLKEPESIATNTSLDGFIHARILLPPWVVTFTDEYMQIGCQLHRIDDWLKFDDVAISKMDHKALGWSREWKPTLEKLISINRDEEDD